MDLTTVYSKELEECAGRSWPQFQTYWSKKRKFGELHTMTSLEYSAFVREMYELSKESSFTVKVHQRKKVRTAFQNFQAQECAKFPPGTGNHLMEVNRRWNRLSVAEKAQYESALRSAEAHKKKRRSRKEKEEQVKTLSGHQLFVSVMTLAYANNGHRLSAPQVAELSPWAEADQCYWNSTSVSGNLLERQAQIQQLAQGYS